MSGGNWLSECRAHTLMDIWWNGTAGQKKNPINPLPQKHQFRSGAVGWLKLSNVFGLFSITITNIYIHLSITEPPL